MSCQSALMTHRSPAYRTVLPTLKPKTTHQPSSQAVIAQKLGVEPFAGKASDVPAPRMTSLVGEVVFDYSNYNGLYVIGRGPLEFETKWSRASDVSIHVYDDPPSINGVALGPREWTTIQQVIDAKSLDFTSRGRQPRIGQIVVFRNVNGFYAAARVLNNQVRYPWGQPR